MIQLTIEYEKGFHAQIVHHFLHSPGERLVTSEAGGRRAGVLGRPLIPWCAVGRRSRRGNLLAWCPSEEFVCGWICLRSVAGVCGSWIALGSRVPWVRCPPGPGDLLTGNPHSAVDERG